MFTSIRDYEKSSTYKFIKDVIQVTQPLKKLGIKYFIYAELTDDYHINCLVDNDKMIRDFINYSGLKYELALSPHKIINSGLYPVSTISKPKEVTDYYEKIFALNQVSDEIIYIADNNNIRKIYIFGVLNQLYTNIEYLELFILYFNDHTAHLMKQNQQLKIPKEFIEDNPMPNLKANNFIFTEMQREFLNNINAKYYKIRQIQKRYALSNRELQCLELILQNKIAKQIANILNLTTRTVETYIDHLRKKLDCRTKNEIVVKFFLE